MKIRYRILIAGCLISTFFVFSYLSIAYCGRAENLKVYYQPSMTVVPVIIAYEEGFFKNEGIDLEFIKGQNSAEALIMLLQGAIDVMDGPPTAGMYNAVMNQMAFKIVAGTNFNRIGDKFTGLAVMNTAGQDVDEKNITEAIKINKIGIPVLGSLPHYFLETILNKHNAPVSRPELVVMSFPLITEAIRKGVVDAGFLVEPFITYIKDDKNVTFIPFADEFPEIQTAFIAFGPNILVKKPEAGIRFMVAYLKGYNQYLQGKTKRNLEIIKKYLGLDESLSQKMSWPFIYPKSILTNTRILSDYQGWLIKNKYLESPVDIESMLDRSYLDNAYKILSSAES